MNRRDLYRFGTIALGNLVALALAVPGVAYLLDPLRRESKQGEFDPLTRLGQLTVGVPTPFAIIDERQDAWVKYPREPIGSVWLIRQPEGSEVPVLAFTAECPHLGCAVNLAGDGKSFLCPCHTSNFDFQGKPLNQVPPRGMDRLDVKLSTDPDPEVRVRFQRFRTQTEEKIPLLNQLADWLDNRTGYRALVHEALEEPIPGGARWRYVFGSALSTTFTIQLVTGLLLMCSYSPSSSTAWGSVFYVNDVMTLGWFIRGIHHFGSQAMVVLVAMHLLQVLVAGAYRTPREVNWWFGMALLFLTLGFSLTGYLLPWDQKGYWATKVATNIMGGAPGVGPYLQKVVVGGSDYGNQTLTRFYGLHVGVLPTLFVLCLAAHVALFRRHGLTPPRNAHKRTAGKFWPEQLFMDSVASVAVFGVLAYLVLSEGGANLDAPADPSSSDYPARPEWYFLSLFQMLKYFPGKREVIGTIVIPTAIMVVLLLIPLFDRLLPGKLAHFLACCLVFALVGGAGYLTYEAWDADAHDKQFQAARVKADEARHRALALAGDPEVRIPPEGSAYILLRDPLYHGKGVLERKCLGCHYYEGKGLGKQTASDLKDFGSRAWVRGLLERPGSDTYFGKVPACDGMAEWKKSSKLGPKQLDDVADFVASFATIPPEMTPEEWLNDPKFDVANHPGQEPFVKECGQCHVVEGLSEGGTRDAPKLFAWGSPRWIDRMIHKPGAPDLYGYLEPKDQMPPFAGQLTENDITMVVRFLKGQYAGATDSTAPRAQVARGK